MNKTLLFIAFAGLLLFSNCGWRTTQKPITCEKLIKVINRNWKIRDSRYKYYLYDEALIKKIINNWKRCFTDYHLEDVINLLGEPSGKFSMPDHPIDNKDGNVIKYNCIYYDFIPERVNTDASLVSLSFYYNDEGKITNVR